MLRNPLANLLLLLAVVFNGTLGAGEADNSAPTNVTQPPEKIFFQGRWVTQEDKEKLEKGLVLYKGKWMPEAEMYEAKGYVKHLGNWISPSRLKTIQKRQEMARERIKFSSDWKNAWKYQTKQGHFIITSNVSPELVQELGVAMEQCYAELSKVFSLRKEVRNINVEVYATQQQFMKHSAEERINVGSNTLGYFYWGPSTGIRAFYAGTMEQTLSTLFHECTHLIMRQVCGDVPTWANEGLAVFFESARRTTKGMQLETIPFGRLWHLKKMMEQGEISLNHLCKLDGPNQYTGQYYPQGWSLIYYLLYAEKGKYRRNFESFFGGLVGSKYDGNSIGTFAKHFGQEPDGLVYNWKEFIQAIEPKTTEELIDASTTAYSEFINFNAAKKYAAQALEQMKGDDEKVLLCNARLHLTLARWEMEQEVKAMHYAKSVEFFERVFPEPEPGKRVVKPRKVTADFASDRLDYARACVGAVQYERAQDLIEEVLSRKEFEFNAEAYSVLAYLAILANDPVYHSIEQAKENASLAEDLGADQENTYVKALIAFEEGNKGEAIKLLNEAASRDEFGFGGQLYRREMSRLSGPIRREVEESKPRKSGK